MSITEIGEVIQALAVVVAALGVWLVCIQLRETKEQAITSFEDSLTRQYRGIIHVIPAEVLLGLGQTEDLMTKHLNDIYNYIDLSNEQVFLRQVDRVRKRTWENWRDGIRSNLSRPTFSSAWEYIKEHSNESFAELRRLEESGFMADPIQWRS